MKLSQKGVLLIGIFFAVLILGALFFKTDHQGSSTTPSIRASDVKKYGVESGEVSYVYTGMKEGTGRTFFDQWGLREHQTTTISEELSGQTKETILITDPDFVTTIDVTAQTGIRVENRLLKSILEEPDGRSLTEIGIDILKELGGELVGTETIAGYECDLWSVEELQLSQCLHKGVLLSMVSEFGGVTFKMEADSVTFGQEIDPLRFNPPANIQVDEAKYPDEVGL